MSQFLSANDAGTLGVNIWSHIKTTFDRTPEMVWAAAGVVVVGTFVLWVAKKIAAHHLKKFSAKTVMIWDDVLAEMVNKTNFVSLFAITFLIGAGILEFPSGIMSVINKIAIVIIIFQFGIWGNQVVGFLLTRYAKKRESQESGGGMSVSVFKFISQVLLWTIILLLILDNLGIDVTTLIAGLGVGGIAVALAVQNILGDLFSSLSILLDKPFKMGDFIVVDDMMGTVEHIGLKTTRISSLSGEQIVFSNSDLLKSRIRNFRKMRERRVLFGIGVIYQTPQDKLLKIPGIIEEIVRANDNVRFERAHFKDFGAYSLDFETVYHVNTRDYMVYMDVQQKINYALFERFAAEGIEFAYPTQTLFYEKNE